jgi:hypothetical protein
MFQPRSGQVFLLTMWQAPHDLAVDRLLTYEERLKRAIRRPPHMGVKAAVQKIHRLLGEVNAEATVLLHDATNQMAQELYGSKKAIEDKCDELKCQNDDLKAANEYLKAKVDRKP